jgi:hypothetical protein
MASLGLTGVLLDGIPGPWRVYRFLCGNFPGPSGQRHPPEAVKM